MANLKKSMGEGGALIGDASGYDNLYAVLSAIITTLNALVTNVNAVGAAIDANKALYDAHTHECPGSDHAKSRCSTPDTGEAENSLAASEASAFTAAPTDATSTITQDS